MYEHPPSDPLCGETSDGLVNETLSDPSAELDTRRKKKRIPYTFEEDSLLVSLVENKSNEGLSISGNLLYNELQDNFPQRHPQSLRSRYLRILRYKNPSEIHTNSLPQKEATNLVDDKENQKWKQIQQVSDLCADPGHLQELMDELRNDPLPDSSPTSDEQNSDTSFISDSNPTFFTPFDSTLLASPPATLYNTTHQSHRTPFDSIAVIEPISLNLAHEKGSNSFLFDSEQTTKKHRNILDLSTEDLKNTKKTILNQDDGTLYDLLEQTLDLNTRDPMFLFLLYQAAGDLVLLIDSLLEQSYLNTTMWDPDFDKLLKDGFKSKIPSCIIYGDNPLYLLRRKNWLLSGLMIANVQD